MIRAWITIIEEAYPHGPPECRIGSLWSRIFYLFYYEMGRGYYRTKIDVKLKMLQVKRHVKHFHRIHSEIENARPDDDEQIILLAALKLFRLESNGREFVHVDSWNVMKNLPYF